MPHEAAIYRPTRGSADRWNTPRLMETPLFLNVRRSGSAIYYLQPIPGDIHL
jgi:hypothetical protein